MSLSLLAMLAITQMNVLDGCDRRWNEQWRQVIVIDPVSWIIILLLFSVCLHEAFRSSSVPFHEGLN